MLIVFGGLPGTGKTTLSAALARRLRASYLRVDAIEAALLATGLIADQASIGSEGYLVANRVAQNCLLVGLTVVVDAVNPVEAARAGWRELAEAAEVPLLLVEVICSDPAIHRRRVEARASDLAGWAVPGWAAVAGRDYEPWRGTRLVIDNLGDPQTQVDRIMSALPPR